MYLTGLVARECVPDLGGTSCVPRYSSPSHTCNEAPFFFDRHTSFRIRAVARNADCEIMHTHDDVGCHPQDFHKVNVTIRATFVAIHTNFDWFGSLEKWSHVTVSRPEGEYDITDALQATYLFS